MSATIKGTAGLAFGTTTETGGYLQSLEVRHAVEKAEVRNETGEFIGVAFYNKTEEVSGEAVMYGSAGLGGIATATALTLASYTPAAGLILVDEFSTKYSNVGFKSTSFKALIYPLITT